MVEYLFDENFSVSRLDPDGKKFDKVTRVEAHNEQMYMQIDVATEVYPMHIGDKFNMVMSPTLNLDGTPDTGFYTQPHRLEGKHLLTSLNMSCKESFTRSQTTVPPIHLLKWRSLHLLVASCYCLGVIVLVQLT